MLLTEYVNVKIVSKNINHYKSLGYECRRNDIIHIPINELTHGSHIAVDIKCDYCGEIISKPYKSYLSQSNIIKKDCCIKCVGLKTSESNLLIYGVSNIMNTDSAKNNMKETNMNRYRVENYSQTEECKERVKETSMKLYGVENAMKLPEFQNKAKETSLKKYGKTFYTKTAEYKRRVKETNLKKYGYSNPQQCPKVKQKTINTNIEKYGVENTFQVECFKEKSKNTMMEKYGSEYYSQTQEFKDKLKKTSFKNWGVSHPLKSPIIRERINNTLYNNGLIRTSSQQIAVYDMLSEIYEDTEINYVVSRSILDVAIFTNNLKIDIEYDGWYWHQNAARDRARDEFLKSCGWKILRIKGGIKIPTIDELITAIDKLINTDRTFTYIMLDWRGG